jgi:tRNA/rRNA methyltransferase
LEITFILVNPAVPENIGASARAIKTMGFNKLKLINPPEGLPGEGPDPRPWIGDILEKAEIFPHSNQPFPGMII